MGEKDDISQLWDRSRRFRCGWGARPETALEIAARVQALNRRLAEIEPEHLELWPMFAARKIRRGLDPGPILEMSVDELAKVIDRRARFDPPAYPAPVDDTGYSLLVVANRVGRDPLDLGLNLHAGAYHDRRQPNEAELDYHQDHAAGRDPELRLRVLQALIEALEPQWAVGGQTYDDPSWERARHRPWHVWTADGAEAPAWYSEHAGPPAETRPAFGGTLSLWSEPPTPP